MEFKTDFGTYLPNPATVIPPPAGGFFIDNLSGVKITRLTDEKDGSGFGTTYSIWPTANCNNTRLWILNSSTNTYYTTEFDPASGTRIGHLRAVPSLPARLFSNYESFLWSGSDADKGFLFVDAKLYSYQPSTQTYRMVKDLTAILGTDYYFLQQHKSTDDKRFAASGPFGFVVYDVEQDRVLLDVRTTDMNGIALDRSGKWLLYVPEDDNTEYIYNVETGAREQITSHLTSGLPDFTIGHCDVGSDFVAGDDEWNGGISARRFSTPHAINLPFVYSPYWISYHLCMTADDQNWALISSYGALPVSADSNKFKDECFLVGVQGEAAGKIKRLFHHRAVANDPLFAKRYWQISKANMSLDGRFVFFTSNMGGGRNDLYVADLGTPTQTPSPDPVPNPPPPEPTPVPPPPQVPPSPDGTKATTINDNNGGVWTFGPEKQTLRNGVLMDRGAGLIYKWLSGVVCLLGTDNRTWYKWSNAWVEIGAQEPGGTTPTPIPEPPKPDPITPPTPKPCNISAKPESINIPRNGSGTIAVVLNDLSGPSEVKVLGSDGQVNVFPLTWTPGPTSTSKQFSVKVKNKKQVRKITFESPCGRAEVIVNVI